MKIKVAYPIDVSMIRDQGMACLVVLAASLGWNVHKRPNSPVILTARDKVQVSIPTNTSIRSSVFQTNLSKIMTHTDTEHEVTVELMDDIIKRHKPNADQSSRLRLASGETVAQHRARVKAMEAPAQQRKEEHLTHKPDLAALMPELKMTSTEPKPDLLEDVPRIVSEKPFQAHSKGQQTYTSTASLERVWSNGMKQYVCVICKKVFDTPKGVGAHKQVHTKKGEAKADYGEARKQISGVDPEWVVTPRVANLANEIDAALEALGRDASGRDLATWIVERRPERTPPEDVSNLTAEQILDRITSLIDRSRTRQLEEEVLSLKERLTATEAEAAELRNWRRALRELVDEEDN